MIRKPFPTLAAVLLLAAALLAPATARAQHCHDAAEAEADPHAAHRAAAADATAAAAEAAESDVSGLQVPDVPVLTQDGDEVRFYSDLVQGRTVAINFVFTTCTTICPPMGATFGRLQKELGARLGDEVFLISVSVDPTTDTPQRLKAWGETFGAGPGWTLVTGEQQEIERLLKALEVFTADIRRHSPVVLIGDDDAGRWTRAYGLASPAELAGIVDRVSGGAAGEAVANHHAHPGAAARGRR